MYILIHFHKKLCAELLRKVKAFTKRTHKIFQGTGTTDKTGTVYPIPILSITCGNRTKQIQFTQYQFCTRRNDLQNRARHYVFAYWVKAAAPQLGRTRTPETLSQNRHTQPATVRAADEKEKTPQSFTGSTGSENRTQARGEQDAPTFRKIIP